MMGVGMHDDFSQLAMYIDNSSGNHFNVVGSTEQLERPLLNTNAHGGSKKSNTKHKANSNTTQSKDSTNIPEGRRVASPFVFHSVAVQDMCRLTPHI